jgi:hypothetical protein
MHGVIRRLKSRQYWDKVKEAARAEPKIWTKTALKVVQPYPAFTIN